MKSRGDRQLYRKTGPLSGLAEGIHMPAVLLNDSIGDGQAEAGPFCLRREEGFKYLGHIFRRYPASRVRDIDGHIPSVGGDIAPNCNGSLLFDCLYGVEQQVDDDLLDLVLINKGLR